MKVRELIKVLAERDMDSMVVLTFQDDPTKPRGLISQIWDADAETNGEKVALTVLVCREDEK